MTDEHNDKKAKPIKNVLKKAGHEVYFTEKYFFDYRKDMKTCRKESCRFVKMIMITANAAFLILTLSCLVTENFFCLSKSLIGGLPTILIIYSAAFLASLIISLFSNFPRTGIIYSILWSIPVLLYLIFYAVIIIINLTTQLFRNFPGLS